MNWWQIGTVILGTALLATPVSADVSPVNADLLTPDDYTQFSQALTDKVAVPAYERFAIETTVLSETLTSVCATPTAEGMQTVRDRFNDTMDAWEHIQPLALGPIMDAPGPSRFQFWPDKRGAGQRHLRSALSTQDRSVLNVDTLSTKSIALSNLQALEYVLFEDADTLSEPRSFRCTYASAIAFLQRTRAALLLQDWTKPHGFREQIENAAQGTDAFFDEREAASAYLNSIIGALELIRLQKLDRPLGLTLESARGKRTENWRSGRSLRNIQLNVETIIAMFNTPNGLGDLTIKAHHEEDAAKAARLLAEIKSNLSTFDRPLSELVSDEKERPTLDTLLTKFRDLQSLIQEHISRDIGLVRGFNATDGD